MQKSGLKTYRWRLWPSANGWRIWAYKPVIPILDKILKLSGKILLTGEGPAILSFNNNILKAIILSAKERNSAGQGFDVGESLSLADGSADKQISHAVIASHFRGRDHSGKNYLALHVQLLNYLLQFFSVRTVSHQDKGNLLSLAFLEESEKLLMVLLFGKSSHGHQNSVILRDLIPRSQLFPCSLAAGKTLQINTRRHHLNGGRYAVAP